MFKVKEILILGLMLMSFITFSQRIEFKPEFIVIDLDTITVKNKNTFSINLFDKIYEESIFNEHGEVIYSNKKIITEEFIYDGVATFKLINGVTFNFKVTKNIGELMVSDDNLIWIGDYTINFTGKK